MKGWECPKCGKVNAPHVDACDHVMPGTAQKYVYVPYESPEAADRCWWDEPWIGYPPIITYNIITSASDKYKAEMEAGA